MRKKRENKGFLMFFGGCFCFKPKPTGNVTGFSDGKGNISRVNGYLTLKWDREWKKRKLDTIEENCQPARSVRNFWNASDELGKHDDGGYKKE